MFVYFVSKSTRKNIKKITKKRYLLAQEFIGKKIETKLIRLEKASIKIVL